MAIPLHWENGTREEGAHVIGIGEEKAKFYLQ